ncbi:hypothetical protein JYQ62_22540 [Nostoc sp. UHCC 0702]|nr:hypothetical protein JYQ62_22540 [Nostoc sp. UHCC 0702]
MTDSTQGGNSNIPSSEVLLQQLEQSPFADVFKIPNVDKEEVLEAFAKAFSDGGVPNPFPTSVGTDDLPYNGNPFAGENFWNIFAGGQDPTKGPGDLLTGGSIPSGGSIPGSSGSSNNVDPFGENFWDTFGGGKDPTNSEDFWKNFAEGKDPTQGLFTGGSIPSGGEIPSFGGGGIPSFGGGIPSFGGGILSFGGGIPSFGGGIPSFGGGIPSFGGGQ